ncbi:protein of unknown function [Fulvimarina manganoxydans]|uniref:Peptidase metallopeptidase domain-containing protein n=2 Tax=Fulvimarina manganoxydans TaxID=937218 RepID=A0A1W2CEN8_9HYPH|nr:protein of unknown function [Fulvimarina manganoxydans]
MEGGSCDGGSGRNMDDHTQDYTLNGQVWRSDKTAAWQTSASAPTTITWSIAASNFAGEAYRFDGFLTGSPFVNAIRAAMDAWEAVAHIDLVESTDSNAVDIRIGYEAIDGRNGTLAQTVYWYARDTLIEAFIGFDTAEPWVSGTGAQGIDFYNVALHEIGHALGLGHDDHGGVMEPYYSAAARTLTADDIAGIVALYGEKPLALAETEEPQTEIVEPEPQVVVEPEPEQPANAQPAGPALPDDPGERAVHLLYDAAFDRTPDAGGLLFWANVLDGSDLISIAESMMTSSEFESLYGIDPEPRSFVAKLYENVLDRPGEAAGEAFWTGLLEAGAVTEAEVLVAFSGSEENVAGEAMQIIPIG